jgi:hypothetical protein
MSGGLTRRNNSVMAARARAGLRLGVIEARPRKSDGIGMAAIALVCRGNVIIRHHRGNDALALAVAPRTIARCTFE